MTGDFECGKCPEKKMNIIKITSMLLLVILVVFGLVFSSLTSAGKAKSKGSVYIKIMTSHLQIINAIAHVSFSWPMYIEEFYLALVTVSKVND
mmetsp:Transcript_43786/g.42253  ORF Transcript_43786/g.42253 Transcript_43786/m.42253 type:complete len:93 (+) Transcript_43786:421-699(+)